MAELGAEATGGHGYESHVAAEPLGALCFRRAADRARCIDGVGPALSRVEGKAIILLCGYADVNQCHRKALADWLAQAWSASVVHLTPPAKPELPGQARLC
jgi:uncharacterized protein (DUF488 family)